MNSSFPGGGKADEFLVATARTTNKKMLAKARKLHPHATLVRFGEPVEGTDGGARFPIFAKFD